MFMSSHMRFLDFPLARPLTSILTSFQALGCLEQVQLMKEEDLEHYSDFLLFLLLPQLLLGSFSYLVSPAKRESAFLEPHLKEKIIRVFADLWNSLHSFLSLSLAHQTANVFCVFRGEKEGKEVVEKVGERLEEMGSGGRLSHKIHLLTRFILPLFLFLSFFDLQHRAMKEEILAANSHQQLLNNPLSIPSLCFGLSPSSSSLSASPSFSSQSTLFDHPFFVDIAFTVFFVYLSASQYHIKTSRLIIREDMREGERLGEEKEESKMEDETAPHPLPLPPTSLSSLSSESKKDQLEVLTDKSEMAFGTQAESACRCLILLQDSAAIQVFPHSPVFIHNLSD